MPRCAKWAVCKNRWSHRASCDFGGVRPSISDSRIVSLRRAALARTRVSRPKAISSTGGDSASYASSDPADRGQVRAERPMRGYARNARVPVLLAGHSAYPAPCSALRAYLMCADVADRPAAPAGRQQRLGDSLSGALDVVSGGVAGAGEVCGEGAASTLSESAPGAASGAGGAGVGAGSGAGAPPEPGAEIPPDWPRAGGAANAVTSSANAASRAPFEPPEPVNSIGGSARMEPQRTT